MNFSLSSILISLGFSAVGYVYFSYGKRMQKLNIAMVGITLMAYSYFVDSIPWSIAIGLGLSATPFVLKWWD